jgi:hypothetical protein
MRLQAKQNMQRMGLQDVDLAGKSYNSGRKQLEAAGFKLERTTATGRKVFYNPRTGAQVFYDSGYALTSSQKPHWHIQDNAGRTYDRSGSQVHPSDDAAQIPGG